MILVLIIAVLFSELKSQYAEQQTPLTNISDYPALLQAIHTLKPTVFKAGGPQHQRQRKYHSNYVRMQGTPVHLHKECLTSIYFYQK